MSVFSECFVKLKNKRNLTGAQIAEKCGKDKSNIFYWLTGKKIPQDWERFEEIVEYMQLFPVEKKELRCAYERTKYGEETYEYFKIFKKMIQVLQQRRDEYESGFVDKITTKSFPTELPDMQRLENKLEIVSEIQRVLEYLETQNEKKLYIKMRTFQPEILMMLKLFCAKVEDCQMILIVSLRGDAANNTLKNLEIWKDALEMIVQKNTIDVFVSEEWNGREEWGENCILSHDFALQFDVNCSCGMLYTQLQWIEFFKTSFEKLKQESKYAGNKKDSIKECKDEVTEKIIIGSSIGYMPYFSEVWNEENTKVQWESYFCYEGLQEFMKTGQLERNSNKIHSVLEEKERYHVLQNMIVLMETGKIQYHIIREDVNVKYLYIEQAQYPISKFVVEVSIKEDIVKRYVVEGEAFQQKFKEFLEYLKVEGYVCGAEESLCKMRKMLKHYSEKK